MPMVDRYGSRRKLMRAVWTAPHYDALTHAVLRHLGGGDDATRIALEAAQHGADAGWCGFTYYSDTCAFARKHRRLIVAALQDDRESFGEPTVCGMFAHWGALKDLAKDHPADLETAWGLYQAGARESRDKDMADTRTLLENALAWYALERAGQAVERAQEDAA